uniref:Pimeloyl-CoA dehydrogenase n=1 Tax=Streptomyces sp. SANK 60404 TaxID=1213862 RepID=A0A1B4ZDE0_9ACTN|nr:pimeloyl-CoA dehydrogenase [Streptomyces sp. SANK 60404]
MELEPTARERTFREEVCALLCADEVREEIARVRAGREEAGLLDVYRSLGERGWLAVNWPKEYGGLDGTIQEKAILTEELIGHGVPDIVHTLSIDIVGLALLLYGTESQKSRLLPKLARGEGAASILFSEPSVGSDLAALETRAERDGDGWRIHGRKVYSMKSHIADFALCAARTTESDVKYHGITLFAVPLKTPGVLVDPLWNLGDERFGDITLTGIRVTEDDVIGEVDGGWEVINNVLGLERTGIEFEAKASRWLGALLRHAADDGLFEHPVHGPRLVELDAWVRAARLLSWRSVTELSEGRSDEVHNAMAKLLTSEIGKEVAHAGVDMLGLPGVLNRHDGRAPAGGLAEAAYRESAGLTLASGTSEIMLALIASAGLGLLA